MTIIFTIPGFLRKAVLYFPVTKTEDLICCKPMQSVAKSESSTKFEKNPWRF
ncbi:MAG: hypothetical protein ACOVMQ_12440 [Cyclobacteriaceae bacterium]|jgi:hypothetical protein